MAQKRKLDYYDDDFDTESLSSFESDEDFVHSISSSEDDTSDEENFSSVRQWCKIDSSTPAPSRFSFIGDVVGGREGEVEDICPTTLPPNWDGNEQNRTVTCMVLKAKNKDRRKNLALSRDEFRGP
ncbi:piggyBac transposable element-derived protein 4 [Trichonephila clavipes]|nr:piggyBac transposable element-derived protein 4 [Trichonephila clavipes]